MKTRNRIERKRREIIYQISFPRPPLHRRRRRRRRRHRHRRRHRRRQTLPRLLARAFVLAVHKAALG